MSELIVSAQHSHAVELHQKIMTSATLTQQNLWDMCTSLKEMRDGKLYKEFGYTNFEDYCETAVGMNRRNAYRYISVVERVKLENVTPVSQIGIKKLALLATLSEEQQTEIAEKVTLEDTTYKELKAEIDKLKAANKELEIEKSDIYRDKRKVEQDAERETRNSQFYKNQVDDLQKKLAHKDEDLQSAEKYIKELESRPVEVAVQESDNDKELREKIETLEAEKARQKDELESDKQAALDKLTAEYEEKLIAIQQQQSQNEAPADDKEIFKVYFKVAYDSFIRLFEFAKDSDDKEFFKEKIGNLLKAFEGKNTEI